MFADDAADIFMHAYIPHGTFSDTVQIGYSMQ